MCEEIFAKLLRLDCQIDHIEIYARKQQQQKQKCQQQTRLFNVFELLYTNEKKKKKWCERRKCF